MNACLRIFAFALLGLLVFAFAPVRAAHAATIDVPCDDVPALIAAINTANSTPEPDTIALSGDQSCIYKATIADNTSLEFGPNAFPVITTKITIEATGWKRIEGSKGNTGIRFFQVAPTGELVLKNLQLRRGRMAETDTPGVVYPGGAIYNDHGIVKINGGYLLSNEGTGDGGVIYNDGGRVKIRWVNIQGNSAERGGGIFNTADGKLVLRDSLFWRFGAGYGGAVFNEGQAKLARVTFKVSGGAGLGAGALVNHGMMQVSTGSFIYNHVADGVGGGITNFGTLSVVNSTFSRNEAKFGGAIWNQGTLTLANSTFNQNTALMDGGAIFNRGTMNILNVTLANNTAERKGGNIMSKPGGATTVANTIISGGLPQNCKGALVVEGGNLRFPESDPTCAGEYGDPMLEVWGKYGSFNEVMPLKPGSRAINNGLAENCKRSPVNNVDQRGVTRVIGDEPRCDSGAYEVE